MESGLESPRPSRSAWAVFSCSNIERSPMKNLSLRLPRFLFLCGLAAFLVPLAQQEQALRKDAEEYAIIAESISFSSKTDIEQTESQEKEDNELPQQELPIHYPEDLPSSAYVSDTSTFDLSPETDAKILADETYNLDLSACRAVNVDFIAWLSIAGTSIDYPVVQSGDTDYYLHHLFTGKKSSLGCLFSLLDADYETPGRNIPIYGHHLRTGDAMFSSLIRYKNPKWLDEHSLIRMDSLFGSRTYRVFAVVNYSVSDWNPSIASMNDRDFGAFLKEASKQSLVQTEVSVNPTDHILTLITCDRNYGGVSGRLAVLAVQEKTEKENP